MGSSVRPLLEQQMVELAPFPPRSLEVMVNHSPFDVIEVQNNFQLLKCVHIFKDLVLRPELFP